MFVEGIEIGCGNDWNADTRPQTSDLVAEVVEADRNRREMFRRVAQGDTERARYGGNALKELEVGIEIIASSVEVMNS